jgi:hypothetical protein
VIHKAPTSDDERADLANVCQVNLDFTIPMLIDSVDDNIEDKYRSAPIRLFVVDSAGVVTYSGDPGPQGYDLDGWEEAIREEISKG